MACSTKVIKVKRGDTLKRFKVSVNEDGQLGLDMEGLRSKIHGVFKFPDSNFTLTYIDEDGEAVLLVDDDDLADVMGQNLKILRIDVMVSNDIFWRLYARPRDRSTGTSTPPNKLKDKLSKLFIELGCYLLR